MAEIERPQHVGDQHLSELLTEAAESTRRRSHLLLHANHQDQVQRLLIALEADSYIQPHMHSEQWEMLILLRGQLDVLIFGPEAEIIQRLRNERRRANCANPALDLAHRGGLGAENASFRVETRPISTQ